MPECQHEDHTLLQQAGEGTSIWAKGKGWPAEGAAPSQSGLPGVLPTGGPEHPAGSDLSTGIRRELSHFVKSTTGPGHPHPLLVFEVTITALASIQVFLQQSSCHNSVDFLTVLRTQCVSISQDRKQRPREAECLAYNHRPNVRDPEPLGRPTRGHTQSSTGESGPSREEAGGRAPTQQVALPIWGLLRQEVGEEVLEIAGQPHTGHGNADVPEILLHLPFAVKVAPPASLPSAS